MLLNLPNEMVIAIFAFLDLKSANIFAKVSKRTCLIAKDPSARAKLLLNLYGKGRSLYYTYSRNRTRLDEKLGGILLQNGAHLPRFLAQIVVKDVNYVDISSKWNIFPQCLTQHFML
jgi:hypothetical protein